ncbi:MAG: sugar transferase, partial [Ferruginibacter sp.]
GLSAFENNSKIFAVSGYSSPIKTDVDHDVYFTRRSSSWGWATWSDRWDKIDWDVSDFDQFNRDSRQQKAFNQMGSDLTTMLRKQMDGKINSWAIRWVYHQFKNDLYTVFPVMSKVSNNGFNAEASNTYKNNESRFATRLDSSDKKKFNFSRSPYLDKNIIKQFVHPYSIKTRVIYKLKALLHL